MTDLKTRFYDAVEQFFIGADQNIRNASARLLNIGMADVKTATIGNDLTSQGGMAAKASGDRGSFTVAATHVEGGVSLNICLFARDPAALAGLLDVAASGFCAADSLALIENWERA